MLNRIASLLGFAPKKPEFLLFAHGATVPTDGTAGYETGAVFQHIDGAEGSSFYVNEGTSSSCNFDAVASLTAAQEALLGATAGVVTASKAVVVDANKDVGDFRNLDCTNLDAGASGTAGTVDVFPTTASKGKLTIDCAAQDADTTVTFRAAGMAQASVISVPDPGAATANVMLTSATNDQARVAATATEIDVLAAVTPGTSAASKALVLDASGDLAAGPIILGDMTPGTGADGAETIEHSVTRVGGLYKTEILIDLAGLNSGGTAGDIIGENPGVANCHLGQITAAKNGTVFAGRVTCLEAPVTGDVDIDLYSATEATGAEDAAISGLTATQLCNSGNQTLGLVTVLTAFPAANSYLYLVNNTPTDGAYSAGKLLIELWGK